MAKMPDFKKVKAFDAMLALAYGQFFASGAVILNDLRSNEPITDALVASIFFAIIFMGVGYERRFLFPDSDGDDMNA